MNKTNFDFSYSKYIVCEGETEFELLQRQLNDLGITSIAVFPNKSIRVQTVTTEDTTPTNEPSSDTTGTSGIPSYLKAIADQNLGARLRGILVIRDADTDAQKAEKALKHDLVKSGLTVEEELPRNVNEFSDNFPRIAISILPSIVEKGMLEDLCVQAVAVDPINDCIREYFKCTSGSGVNVDPLYMGKAYMQVWSAVRYRPAAPFHAAIKAGKFDNELRHPAFTTLRNLLVELDRL